MENKPLSWVMAARKFGIANADDMFRKMTSHDASG
jgi:hypothetical protein